MGWNESSWNRRNERGVDLLYRYSLRWNLIICKKVPCDIKKGCIMEIIAVILILFFGNILWKMFNGASLD